MFLISIVMERTIQTRNTLCWAHEALKSGRSTSERRRKQHVDGYGEWDDGHDWETEGTAADALSEFIDHLAEDSEVERIDKDEIMYDGMRLELKVEEREEEN